jgi:MFS family permease
VTVSGSAQGPPLERGAGPASGSVVASAALGAALTPLNSTMVAVALPALSAEFMAPAASVTLFVVTGYLVATLVAQMPAGSVADRVGYARALSWGRWMFAAGAVAGTLAPTLWVVIVARLLMAAGSSLINPTAMALLRISVPPQRRARAFGTMGAVMGGAAAIGPALGAALVSVLGWRSLFLINLPLLAVSWLLQPAVRKPGVASDAPAGQPERGAAPSTDAFDWPGSLLTGAALLLVTFAARRGGAAGVWMAVAAVAVFGVLFWHERRVPKPVLQTSLFREHGFTAGALIISTQNLAMYSLMIQVPFLFGDGVGDSRLGLAIIAMTATMAVMSPVGGWLVERIGVRVVVGAGGLLAAAGVIGLAQLPPTAGSLQIAGRLLLVGLGLGLSTGPANASALTVIPSHLSATASATVSMLRYLGAIAGTVILGYVFAEGADGATRHHVALWIFVGALLASALLGATLPPLRHRD